MKKIITATIILFSIVAFTLNSSWKNDKAHSQLTFTVTHLGISDVTGEFKDFDVKITSEKEDFSDAVFELTAKAASIYTRVEARDKHLASADFFDVEKHPEITFKSTNIKKVKDNLYLLIGNLTIRGITKPVALDLVYNGTIENPNSKTPTAGFQLTGQIKRSDFSVGGILPELVVSDVVRIKADGEFTKQ